MADQHKWRVERTAVLGWLVLMSVTFGVQAGSIQAQTPRQESLDHFENHVRPMLVDRCIECHGPLKSEAGLRVDQREHLLAGGDSGAAIVPGQPEQSLLLSVLTYEGDIQMPPEEKLSDIELDAVKRWIQDGAAWPDDLKLGGDGPAVRSGPITEAERQFWSLQSIQDPLPPAVESEGSRPSEIDRFILKKLTANGLAMRPPASRRELIRRATFDLTGLPPTPEEIQEFLADPAPDAFAKVVDRLLDSPAYGERWGRHWLDVVRYADSAGETADYPTPLAYKYRNWVIQAFNEDLSYDEFVRCQIAGDLIARERLQRDKSDWSSEELRQFEQWMTATGYIAISRRFGFDVENYHHLTIQDTIDTTGQAFLGLSLGCARCHDHKYDPVNMEDYYSWYGIFESTRYSFPGSEEKKRPYDLFPVVPDPIAQTRQQQYDLEIERLNQAIEQLSARQAELASRLSAFPGAGNFDGFESETIGQRPSERWGPLAGVKISGDAQSPYENVFRRGRSGVSAPSNHDNNAIGCSLDRNHTAATSPILYYNIDFRNTTITPDSQAAYRFYVGRGPGHSAAVEMAANGSAFLVKNGTGYEAICDLTPGRWYNLQIELDLASRTFQGIIGTADQAVRFVGKQFTEGWDGNIDYTFVDRYGPGTGAPPGHDLDNLLISTSPLLPLKTSVAHETEHLALSFWQDYIEQRRVLNPAENHDGHDGLDVWHAGPLPMIGVSRAAQTLMVPGVVRPGSVVVHPGEREGMGVGWRSPISGKVRIQGYVEDAHDCGDSVVWFLDHLGIEGLVPILDGSIEPNGKQKFEEVESTAAAVIDIQQGEWLQLAVMPKSHYGCDLTAISFRIEEVDGDRVWDLGNNVATNLTQGNPHSDPYGNRATWYFYQVAEDRGASLGQIDWDALLSADLESIRDEVAHTGQAIFEATAQRDQLLSQGPFERVYAAVDRDSPSAARIQLRGEPTRPGDEAPRRNLTILGGQPLDNPTASGRGELAEWLVDKENPLTARVVVNRIWQHHFGRGIVGTENDFGTRGELPTHPELLDWLASRMIEQGWSIKAMHRRIMNTAVYQQSTAFDSEAATLDPESRLLWRFNRRRLSAEEIRDAMLRVSGKLDRSIGGPHPFPDEETWGYTQHAPFYGVYDSNLRSVYLMQQRLKRHPFLGLFDGADTNASTARRSLTTVPTQALYLMNNEFVHQCGETLARRAEAVAESDPDRLNWLFETTLGRLPSEDEIATSIDFLSSYQAATASRVSEAESRAIAWSALCRTLITRNEFLFVD